MPDFSRRSIDPEIMDDLEYSGAMMDRTLHELEVINRLLGGNAVTMGALNNLVADITTNRPIKIADLGCGRADMLRLITQWARKKGFKVKLTGVDANAYIIHAARTNLRDHPEIELMTENIFSNVFRKRQFDIVIGTLFYHHFTDDELVQFFSTLKHQVHIGFIINDIHRHPVAYHSIKWLTKFFSKSDMVKFDAPLSVRRSFKKSELTEILSRADIREYTIRWRWAFRWQVLVHTRKHGHT